MRPPEAVRFFRRLTLPDVLALGLLVFLLVWNAHYVHTRVVEDFWYHTAIGHWTYLKGQLLLEDPVFYQPYGRAQLYPPLIHVLLAFGEAVLGTILRSAFALRILCFAGAYGATWAFARRYHGPLVALLATAFVAQDYIFFKSIVSLMPAVIVTIAALLLPRIIERGRWTLAGILLFIAFMSHLMFPWLLVLGLGILAWARPETRKTVGSAIVVGIALSLPWFAHTLIHIGEFNTTRMLGDNPLRGAGVFAYATHYYLPAITTTLGAAFLFRRIAPRGWLRRLLIPSPALAMLLIAGFGPDSVRWRDLGAVRSVAGTIDSVALRGFWETLPFQIGSFFGALAVAGFVLVGIRYLRTKGVTYADTAVLAFLLGFLPAMLLYGGRYFWEAAPFIALLAARAVGAGIDHAATRPRFRILPMAAALLALMFPFLPLPIYNYTRNSDQTFLFHEGPPIVALRSETRAELDWPVHALTAYLRRTTPPDEIIHVDDPRTAGIIATLADRPVDNGLFWEVQQPVLHRVLQHLRLNLKEGVYVATKQLPLAYPLVEVFGRWGIARLGIPSGAVFTD